jgi:hypothetical protein
MERKTFGKRLCDHPIIREKLSNMARQVEAAHALIELYAWSDSILLFQFPFHFVFIFLNAYLYSMFSSFAFVLLLLVRYVVILVVSHS